jgi:nicotinate dehydrogenase subunit A
VHLHRPPRAAKRVRVANAVSSVALTVNGAAAAILAAPETPLLDALRNHLGLTGTRYGCGAGQCGACMVLIDGVPAYSCATPLAAAAGRRVTTVEGLGSPAAPHPLHRAFLAEQAGQCGYCLAGILIAAAALLARDPDPSRAAVAAALDPHLCRCGAHNRMIRAVQRAGRIMRGVEP